MSLRAGFNKQITAAAPLSLKRKAPAPFSLRLTDEERARLTAEAKGAPPGAYIKAKALSAQLPVRLRRSGLAVEDRKALAQALGLLGRSQLASNLNQLAQAAHVGSLIVTPDTENELREAAASVRELRALLLAALGLKPEAQP